MRCRVRWTRRCCCRRHVVVVADTALAGDGLADAIVNTAGPDAQLDVLAPMLVSHTHYVTSDHDAEARAAGVKGTRARGRRHDRTRIHTRTSLTVTNIGSQQAADAPGRIRAYGDGPKPGSASPADPLTTARRERDAQLRELTDAAVEVPRRRQDRRRALRPRAGRDRRRALRHAPRGAGQPADAGHPLERAQGPGRQGAAQARRTPPAGIADHLEQAVRRAQPPTRGPSARTSTRLPSRTRRRRSRWPGRGPPSAPEDGSVSPS
jgi:hypothetical protein